MTYSEAVASIFLSIFFGSPCLTKNIVTRAAREKMIA